MRHRKVLNLYDTDRSHEELLIYLEGIEGSTRQAQALLQMALIGYRVVALHESGDEAYYSARNPDAAKALKRKTQTRLAAPMSPHHKIYNIPDNPPRIERRAATLAKSDFDSVQSSTQNIDSQSSASGVSDVPPDDYGQDDEFNTLKILHSLSAGE